MVTKRKRTADATRRHRRARQWGFTYLWLLLVVALTGVWLQVVSEVWATTRRQQQLAELNWVGEQYRSAIGSFYGATPSGMPARYPAKLADLVDDRRQQVPRRHLREVYANPVTGTVDWQFIRSSDGGIRGVATKIAIAGRETEYVYAHEVLPAGVGKVLR